MCVWCRRSRCHTTGTSGSAKDLGEMMARPGRTADLLNLTPPEVFFAKSVKMSIFFGPKFSRSHPAARAPMCPILIPETHFCGVRGG
jgi:hypothetical protein